MKEQYKTLDQALQESVLVNKEYLGFTNPVRYWIVEHLPRERITRVTTHVKERGRWTETVEDKPYLGGINQDITSF